MMNWHSDRKLQRQADRLSILRSVTDFPKGRLRQQFDRPHSISNSILSLNLRPQIGGALTHEGVCDGWIDLHSLKISNYYRNRSNYCGVLLQSNCA
jgi:hypothetical protein